MDVTNDDSVRGAVELVARELGDIDVLVNNAGNGGSMSRWRESDSAAVRAMFDVHLFGAERVMRAVVPSMTMPLNLPKVFEPGWVAEQFVHFLAGRRSEALPGGNGALLLVQRLSPALAGHIMEKIGFGALERGEAGRLPPRGA